MNYPAAPMPPEPTTKSDRLKLALLASPRLYRVARRPFALGRYYLKRPHDPAYAAFRYLKGGDGIFLDVGANAGMSALSFRLFQPDVPIVSIEPNPFHEPDLAFLKRRVLRDFDYRLIGAGAEPHVLSLHVPVYNGTALTAIAALERSSVEANRSLRSLLGERIASDRFEVVKVKVDVRPLDELELEPDFVKLVVQGAEYPALLGMRRTLERRRPVVMVQRPNPDVRTLFGELGYSAWTATGEGARLEPEDRWALNIFFLPDV
jgi:FkbM family methyltransferase